MDKMREILSYQTDFKTLQNYQETNLQKQSDMISSLIDDFIKANEQYVIKNEQINEKIIRLKNEKAEALAQAQEFKTKYSNASGIIADLHLRVEQ